MLDSTARAERIDITSSEPAFYTWEAAQMPVSVRLPLALIDRLEADAVETFRSLSSRGSEIGGLLLGSTAPGSPALVTVADFELIPCDYSRGPLYRLSEIDLGRFQNAIEKYGSSTGARVVGYFRSHTRKGLTLDAEDLAFFEPRFLEPQQIVLLIRPFATKASSAGIFIRENGRLGDTSHLEFPFRSSEITAPKNGGEKSEPSAAGMIAQSAAPAAPPAKPVSRAQIVPIASRREITLPEPSAPVQPAASIVAEPAPAPAAQKTAAPPAESEKPAEKPAEKPSKGKASKAERAEKAVAPARSETAEPKAAVVPAVVVAAAPAVETPAVEVVPAAPNKNKKLRLVVAAAVGMLILVGGSLVVVPSLRNRIFPAQSTAQQDSSPLSLRVERTTGGMQLSWDVHSRVIQNASKVTLSITDGDRHENVQLDPNQVRTGSVLYPPITGDVSFQMEVTDPKQTKTTSESLRVLDPRPSPLADPSDSAKDAKATPTTPAKPTPATAAASTPDAEPAAEVKTPEETSAPRNTTPLKPFNTDSLAQRLRPVNQADLPDAPSIAHSASASPTANLPGMMGSQVAPPPMAKQSTSGSGSTPSSTPSTSAVPTGGQLKPAVVVTRVEPEYPRLARQAGASGIVELQAIIGVDGKVKNPHVVKGNQMLQRAAIDAVLQWRYIPAVLNGKAVESPVEIKLNFVQSHN